MADIATVVALIVAGVALVIAAGQLAQQLLATAYVIKKCDRIVTGGVTKGGTKQFHWRQFRYTVKYQAVVFAFPPPLYSALGVQGTVQVDSPSEELWTRAIILRPKRATTTQGCWISFIQDLAMSACIRPEGICLKEESGDRVPEDLTVAPTRVDAITVMLAGVAMGMQVSKYAPTTGEISMAGSVGGISSAVHPILGGLLHYSVFASEPNIGFEEARRHGHALLQEKGVWAYAVFGRFKDRSYRPDFNTFATLQKRKMDVLRDKGWPEGSYVDTIGGAACFLAFTHVDIYEAVPPSCVRRWCAHFAETIIKSHLLQLAKELREGSRAQANFNPPSTFYQARQVFIDRYGCSSPYLPWEDLSTGGVGSAEKADLDLQIDDHTLLNPEHGSVLACPGLITYATDSETDSGPISQALDERDPSSYVPTAVAWEAILLADQRLRHIYKSHGQWPDYHFGDRSEQIAAKAISSLAEVGAPSWGRASEVIEKWPEIFSAACNEVLKDQLPSLDKKWVSVHAHLSILRASYFTIMMRSASSIGPGITEDMEPDTALAYMA